MSGADLPPTERGKVGELNAERSVITQDAQFNEASRVRLMLEFEEIRQQYAKLVAAGKSEGERGEKNLIQSTTQALTLVGLGLYGALRFGQQIYCNKLGITPEEIGLSYIASLSRAGVILLALASPLTVLFALSLLNGPVAGVSRGGKVIAFLLTALLSILTIAFILGVWKMLGDRGMLIVLLLSGIFGFSFVLAGIISELIQWRRRRKGPTRPKAPLLQIRRGDRLSDFIYSRRVLLLALTVIGLLISVSFALAGFAADRNSRDVKNGNPVTFNDGLSILGVYAQPSRLTGNVPPEPDISKKRLMYLGRAENSIVLYDVNCKQPLRIPAEGVTVVVLPAFPDASPLECQ
jgi:hypothetical protein